MTALIRRPDWRARLRAWLIEVDRLPLVPGQHDCCLFVAGAVEAQTGVDLAAPWRGRYTTYAGGRRILRKAGFADHGALFAAHLTEAHVSTALPGDLALLPTPEGDAGGVVQGAALYALSPLGRLIALPLGPEARLFKIGTP